MPARVAVSGRAQSDHELLLAVGTGDHQALASLYDRLAGLVYANVGRALHDTSRTDTVAEEAFFEVWRQAAGYDPSRTSAVLWILDVVHRLAAEHNRYDDSRASADEAAV